jgi:hypothetical protein
MVSTTMCNTHVAYNTIEWLAAGYKACTTQQTGLVQQATRRAPGVQGLPQPALLKATCMRTRAAVMQIRPL